MIATSDKLKVFFDEISENFCYPSPCLKKNGIQYGMIRLTRVKELRILIENKETITRKKSNGLKIFLKGNRKI